MNKVHFRTHVLLWELDKKFHEMLNEYKLDMISYNVSLFNNSNGNLFKTKYI